MGWMMRIEKKFFSQMTDEIYNIFILRFAAFYISISIIRYNVTLLM